MLPGLLWAYVPYVLSAYQLLREAVNRTQIAIPGPFHGEQYIVLTLSTRAWYDERLPLDADDLLEGGLPQESAILPWAVASLGPDGIERTLRRTTEDVVDGTVVTLISYLGIAPGEG